MHLTKTSTQIMSKNYMKNLLTLGQKGNCHPWVTQVRYRYKKSWAEYRKKKMPSEHALIYFDQYHKQVYDSSWSSMRLALLSAQKYGALVNNYSADYEETVNQLKELGARNIVKTAIKRHVKLLMMDSMTTEHYKTGSDSDEKNLDESDPEQDDEVILKDDQNIHEFVPPKKVYSDDELYAIEQYELSVFQHRDVGIQTIPDKELTLPKKLEMFCYEIDDVSMFPSPSGDGLGKLGYYLQDAASILPVLALDIRPGDKVLDLCSAPGGKSLAIAQTLLPGSITCNDNSESRLQRLLQVTRSYLPDNFREEGSITITRRDAKVHYFSDEFDRVLVDVPCLTDRHVIQVDENNIFRPGRIHERINLPHTQCSLLQSGLEACVRNGTVVYSTCTLANAQNDGVIEATLEKIHETSDKRFVVVDISVLKKLFHDVFYFYDRCRHGILVVPNIRSNFGPMYVCKLKRIQ